jgi:hypothetical protein
MKAIHITAYTHDASKVEALAAFMKALKIEFELSKEESPYNPEFVDKIQQGDQDLKNGKGRAVTVEELDGMWK